MSKPTITITYCPKCGWLLRATYMAAELLSTFVDELGGVMLKPAGTAGEFRISIDGEELIDRKADGGFPEITALKRLVRDRIAPQKPLGHVDRRHEVPGPKKKVK